ncbi:MAG TPA: crossover junction endodeoxyribonuclease RuvC [Actinocrinis sp.]|uniref:crossover junction endodeoxyribonuclease RuvC n=1 Tax=Actinocrinis sp. TaxID=1920516 RepID=UPI002DDC93DE|nr:crossover junction endodeoxyribonuclease RuvC [Actinocrinis sp.]HEV2344562.1 crossover junction endodeoxyribonuclease RuvC [Actinocrinis sp.]
MRVLGVDPGLTRMGVGVVEGRIGAPLRMVAAGVVRTAAELPISERLLAVDVQIEEWLDEQTPDAVAVERMFAQEGVRTIMGTAQAAGVVMVAAARRGLPVAMHTPSEVKAAITGDGRAQKEQVAAMVVRILKLAETPKPVDATDALALAICHVWRGGAADRIAEALQRQGMSLPSGNVPMHRERGRRKGGFR